ncbi:hypothetical protein MCELHM10_02015 [Paracoccaceae bacterium]|jgi:hypothetical protein
MTCGHENIQGIARMRLMMVLYSMIATAMAGSGVIAVLTMGYATLWPILAAAVVGAVLALPVSWAVAREIS